MIGLEWLNTAPPEEFAQALDGIFEHSPWVASRAAARRPFDSAQQLHEGLCAVVDEADPAEQMTLIRAHPLLGSGGRRKAELTPASAGEQRRAGLDACTPADFARLDELNAAYVDRFAMPFILAVRGHNPASIIAVFESRLANDPELERRCALREICAIAGFRLAERFANYQPLSDERR